MRGMHLIQMRGMSRGTSLIRNRLLLGTYSSHVSRGLGWSWGGARFLMGEALLYQVLPDELAHCFNLRKLSFF